MPHYSPGSLSSKKRQRLKGTSNLSTSTLSGTGELLLEFHAEEKKEEEEEVKLQVATHLADLPLSQSSVPCCSALLVE